VKNRSRFDTDAVEAESERASGAQGRARTRPSLSSIWAKNKRDLTIGAIAVACVSGSAALGYRVAGNVNAPNPNASWHGKIQIVARAPGSDASKKGITIKTAAGTSDANEGAEVGAGSEIVTDDRTRGSIAFDDGTVVAIDRSTRIVIGAAGRALRLEDGQIIADVAHIEGANPAKLWTPSGDVAVLGTKLALMAAAERTSVEVMRGAVELRDGSKSIQIGAGEEGVAARGEPLQVAPVNDLAQRLAFGERLGLSGVHNEDTDLPVSGLGELRARRPGRTDEKDHATRMSHHGAKIRIAGNVARTEIDETFANDTNDDLEGIYRFPLPPGAQIERLALEVDGKLIDGEFVDTQKGEAIFRGAIHNATPDAPKPKEQIIWVPGPWHDPALLEWQRGGRFELRIFPIPKHGSRRVVLAYTETIAPVAGLRRYTYPLPDAAALTIGQFDADIQVLGDDPKTGVKVRGYELAKASGEAKGDRFTMSAQNFVPSGDLTVEYALADRSSDVTAWGFADSRAASGPPSPAIAVANAAPEKNYVALAFRPKLSGWTESRPHDVVIAVDSGRSMYGERFQRARRLAVQIAQEMDRRDRVAILACDTTCRAMTGGLEAAGSTAAHDADVFLGAVEPDGASDLVGAVRAASSLGGRDASHDLRVVLLSDGIASAGYRSTERIGAEVHDALAGSHDEAVAVPIGADADTITLGEIARGGGGVVIPYAPGEMLESAALDVLNATYGVTLRDVALSLPEGLSDAAPQTLAPIRAGGEVIVAARMSASEVNGDAILRGTVAGAPFEARYPLHVVASTDLGNAFVPRIFAAARIADEERGTILPPARADVVALSRHYRVASRFTSLLVLESEAMFRAFGIDRADAAPLWTGEDEAASTEVATLLPDEEKQEAAADKNLDQADPFTLNGLSGKGLGGGGSGDASGQGFGHGAGRVGGAQAFHAPPRRPTPIPPRFGKDSDEEGESAAETKPKAPPPPAQTTTPAVPAATATPPTDGLADARKKQSEREAARANGPTDDLARDNGGAWMKRVWTRSSTIAFASTSNVSADRIAAARTALAAAPDERAKYIDFVHVLSAAGATDELGEVLARWSARDPLDDAAITARADLAARAGDRDRALRVIDGVATGVNAPTSRVPVLESLALAHERAGDKSSGCAFRLAAADVRAAQLGAKSVATSDVERFARAAVCERADGHGASAERWLSTRGERFQIEEAANRIDSSKNAPAAENTAFGDVIVDATWDAASNVDVDLAVIDPNGNRLAWSGKSSNVRAADPTSRRHETIAVSSTAAGSFDVEVVRAAGSTVPVTGTITIRSLGESKMASFTLSGVRATVADVVVRLESHLEAVTDALPPFDAAQASQSVRGVALDTCSDPGGPTGSGRAYVTFNASGHIASVVVASPFLGTSVGACVTSRLSRVLVAPFDQGVGTVTRAFVIPP
jgi:hypothetical protein